MMPESYVLPRLLLLAPLEQWAQLPQSEAWDLRPHPHHFLGSTYCVYQATHLSCSEFFSVTLLDGGPFVEL